ncbi:MAG: glycosyltransferase family 4 protein [Bacteroidota bacterium]|nr:glycosyltransferase family 4 protein [Bacteroidota bacterium]MDP4205903.1 glycosyltransferase family 4 protein [Bacteroidota bacterium]
MFFYISKEVSSQVLVIGPSYKKAKGGIASLLKSYARYFETFNFIPTTSDGTILYKIVIFWTALLRFVYTLTFKRIRIVHIHGASYGSFVRKSIIIHIAHFFRKKIIYHIHGGEFIRFIDTCRFRKQVLKTLNLCDVILVLSDQFQKSLMILTGHRKIRILNNLIGQPESVNGSSSDQSVVNFLYLGDIRQAKGIYDLVEAISDYKEELQGRMKLIIGGTGNSVLLNSMIKENGLEQLIEYKGWIGEKEKTETFKKSKVFILPSYYEGMPMSILEAMSYGLSIIATDVGGISEIVKNGVNGFLISPGDKYMLIKSIRKFIDHPSLHAEFHDCSLRIVRNYFPESVFNELNLIYKDTLNQ